MASEYSKLEKVRLEKIETLRAEGIEPYPTRAKRTHTSQEAIQAFEQAEASRAGRTCLGDSGRTSAFDAHDGQDHLRTYRRWLWPRATILPGQRYRAKRTSNFSIPNSIWAISFRPRGYVPHPHR